MAAMLGFPIPEKSKPAAFCAKALTGRVVLE
jgi:hypothetical protein